MSKTRYFKIGDREVNILSKDGLVTNYCRIGERRNGGGYHSWVEFFEQNKDSYKEIAKEEYLILLKRVKKDYSEYVRKINKQ